tara:strand:- start:972 stop:1097 length:126 start_codon:yes stop_codon:yes gene_type:complete
MAEERIENLETEEANLKTRILNQAEELRNLKQVLANHIGKK